ncbi:mechanosensitive ion channel family protein [uncultured Dialister sp.]|jgi:small-conductance mechanosensitive channel|uniref:mechanosensitive ion channel family protein n=1 Tax=uncultured Dialister sp. TaxID=278064 RepID=UPI0025FB4754|nr:mechanosensitive ion channel family protein [uncultured Dialister sp.]
MDSVITMLKFELEHGGPHVHFAAMILFIIIGIFVLHGIFRLFIEVLCRVTKVPRDSWRNIFRFMPTLLGILMGIQMAKNILNLPPFVQEMLSYHYHSVVIITVTFFCAHTVSSFLKDKLSKSGDKQATTSILTTVVDLGVYVMGILFILSSYGISISPLLTALGAGGLASALALQDTLANLFSGITTLVSKQVHMGDYIRLAGGEAGRVVDMNWRNTTIRTSTGNMVIVPNKSIANATLTNYEQPLAECTIFIPITITYNNDLDHVEEVTLKVARYILDHSEYGVTGFQPLVRYDKMGDYGISFNVVLRIRNIVDEAVLKHQFIKEVYSTYKKEGIELLVRHD